MRYVASFVALASIAGGVAACGAQRGDAAPAATDVADRDASSPAPAATQCGDAEDLPSGANRHDAAHTLTVACDVGVDELAATALADGVVRLRYGKDARGSLAGVVAAPATEPLRVGRRGPDAVLCTAALELTLTPGTCRLTAKDLASGRTVIDDGASGGFFRAQRIAKGETSPRDVVGVARPTPPGERFYGLGLHTAASRGLDLRGGTVELYTTDAYDVAAGGFRPDASPLYEAIPFYAALRDGTAYGIYTDNTHRMRFDLAATDPERIEIAAWGGAVDQYLVAGPRLADVVRRYTRLTGRAPLPAPWSLGFHQSRWEGPCDGPTPEGRPFCSAAQIRDLVKAFRDKRIPLDGVFLDIQHMNGFRTFTFDTTRFADPSALVADLAAMNVRASIIVDPGIKVDPSWDVYQRGLSAGHFLHAPGESAPHQGEVWPGPSVFPDFTSPDTRAWWRDLVADAASRGVAGMWIDMNEPASFTTGTVPDALVVAGDGRPTTMAEAHNVYGFFEARATFEGLEKARPDERPFILSRAAFAGQQRWTGVWTGDAPSTWTTLAGTLPQLLSLGMSGMTFAGSDVGGYSGRDESTSDLFSRWMALGAISPFFRAHAEKDARRQEPWAFGAPVEDATRELVGLRYELFPYLYSVFDEASRTGAPVLRPLVFEFQDDPKTHAIADEAMVGPSLLVAPVLARAASTRDVYLPPGTWTELRSGAVHAGAQTITLSSAPEWLPEDALPLFAREGAIVPRSPGLQHTGERVDAPLLVDVFPGAAESRFTLHEDDGRRAGASSRTTFTARRTESGARVTGSAPEGAFVTAHPRVLVHVRNVAGAPTDVRLDGSALVRRSSGDSGTVPLGSYVWDAAARTVVVAVRPRAAFTLEVAHPATALANGDVDVPLRVEVPPGTEAVHVAASTNGWTHVPLTRSGDVATGTLRVPRGGWAFFKITRGSWSSVEKTSACADIENRHAPGAARAVPVTVARWADRGCP